MKRRPFRRFLMGAAAWLLVISLAYLTIEGVLIYLERLGGIDFRDARLRMGGAILLIGCIAHGAARVISAHPAFDTDYRSWLMAVPWTNRKPLPFEPVEIVWNDAVVVVVFMLLSRLLPVSIAPWLVVAWLLANLAMLGVSFFLTRTTEFCYLTLLGLGFAVLMIRQPYVAIAILAATYAIAYLGIRRALDAFPWEPRKIPDLSTNVHELVGPRGHAGWPYERMLGQVVASRGLSRPDAILVTLLAAFWLYVLSSLLPQGVDRSVPAAFAFSMVLWLAPLIRLGAYTTGYEAPLSLFGRVATLRLIIPRYDVVFVTPLCTGVVGLLVFLGSRPFAPLVIVLPIAAAVVVMVALLGPPSLRKWRLTGGHKITLGGQINKNDFVEAG